MVPSRAGRQPDRDLVSQRLRRGRQACGRSRLPRIRNHSRELFQTLGNSLPVTQVMPQAGQTWFAGRLIWPSGQVTPVGTVQ